MTMNLKSKNTPVLTGFVLLNLFLYFFVQGIPVDQLVPLSKVIDLQNPLLAIGLYLAVLLLTYFLPESLKNSVVYWRINNPLPGTRVFSELAPKDPRISMLQLENQHGPLPTDPLEENRLWYKIYLSKESDPVVSSSHSRWLLTRDITVIALELSVLFSIGSLVGLPLHTAITYMSLLVLQYLLFDVVARNSGERFVCNVLAR